MSKKTTTTKVQQAKGIRGALAQSKRLSAFINQNSAKLSEIKQAGACPFVLFEADPSIVSQLFPGHKGGPIITAFPEASHVEAQNGTESDFLQWLRSPKRAMILVMNEGTVLLDSGPGGLEVSPVTMGPLN